MNIDPLAEEFYDVSSYIAMMNNPISFIDPDGRFATVPGSDGKPITYSEDKNGNLKVSDNATDDTKQIVAGINESGSETAKNQFKGVVDSEGIVNLKINNTDTPKSNGTHQPHDANGNALQWDSEKGMFDGVAETFTDSKGNTVFKEATITVFSKNLDDMEKYNGLVEMVWDIENPSLTKSDAIIGTFAHEVDHNLNQNTVKLVKDNGMGIKNNYKAEPPAYKVQGQVYREISKNRKKN